MEQSQRSWSRYGWAALSAAAFLAAAIAFLNGIPEFDDETVPWLGERLRIGPIDRTMWDLVTLVASAGLSVLTATLLGRVAGRRRSHTAVRAPTETNVFRRSPAPTPITTDAEEHFPRIESATDSFGNTVRGPGPTDAHTGGFRGSLSRAEWWYTPLRVRRYGRCERCGGFVASVPVSVSAGAEVPISCLFPVLVAECTFSPGLSGPPGGGTFHAKRPAFRARLSSARQDAEPRPPAVRR